ncbi:hypothetical protein [Hoeflea sp. 108]|jgi:hypothetical protein|uniref:hypothetical protein n=1 Tax=Hoeflea sp. 108 TaxID=1116369 RepID=UPI00036612DB|nr:hypothetical protein [Hoeflea sp. 108]
MTRYVDETERERHDRAIGDWDNEGSASVRTAGDEQYGRRIEADRSWTIYHVFTGVPAAREGLEMIGLSRSVATDGMLSLNRRNEVGRRAGSSLLADIRTTAQARPECQR